MIDTKQQLLDRVWADLPRRARASRLVDAIAGRRRGLEEIEQHLPVPGRSPHRMLRYLLGILAILAVYTGLLTLGWHDVAPWALVGLVALGGFVAWWEHRPAPAGPDVPTHVGFADDPAELDEQLAALRPPRLPLPAGPPEYVRTCARCGFDPLAGMAPLAEPAADPPLESRRQLIALVAPVVMEKARWRRIAVKVGEGCDWSGLSQADAELLAEAIRDAQFIDRDKLAEVTADAASGLEDR